MDDTRKQTEEIIISSFVGVFEIKGDVVIEVSTGEMVGEFLADGALDMSKVLDKSGGKPSKAVTDLYNALMEANIRVVRNRGICR